MALSWFDLQGDTIKHLKPERVFAVLAMVAGTCLVFLTGPLQGSDEVTHFRRAYQLCQGQIIASRQGSEVGGQIPYAIAHAHDPFANVIQNPANRINTGSLFKKLHEPFDRDPQNFSHFLMPAVYAPNVYIPQALGIGIGRLCRFSAIGMMYSARIMNLLCWIAVIYAAIRITPIFKWVFVLVALLPMNIFLAATLSADAPTNAMSILLVALVFGGMFTGQVNIKWPLKAAMILICTFLALAKQAYLPLVGLVFLIPADRLGGIRRKLLFCSIALTAALAATLLWSWANQGLLAPFHQANAPEQMSLLLADPWIFAEAEGRAVLQEWRGYVIGCIGALGFYDIWLPKWLYYTVMLLIPAVAVLDTGQGGRLPWPHRFWIGLLCIGVFLLVEFSLYLIWTPPGASIVEGVQGRYFLPIVIPGLLMLFYNRRFKWSNEGLLAWAVGAYLVVVLAVTCVTVYARYYGPIL